MVLTKRLASGLKLLPVICRNTISLPRAQCLISTKNYKAAAWSICGKVIKNASILIRWAGLDYPAIASFKVSLQGGNRSPNVFSKYEQSKAEKSGRVAGVGKSSLCPGSMV